jgi:uncharacterized protein YjbI with pentapeptide repeats
MADASQLKRLKQGVDGWNKWREDNSIIDHIDLADIDLSGADLSGADLRKANLQNVNLSKAILFRANLIGSTLFETNLREADLRHAYLNGADLSRANLRRSNLKGIDFGQSILNEASFIDADLETADLSSTNLSGAHFCRANLRKVNLSRANLNRADLMGANLEGAFVGHTIFAGIDMSKVDGLEKITHYGSSVISTETLVLSKGKIPEKFLRECGLSNWEIESAKLYQPGLSADQVSDITYEICRLRAGNPIQYHSVFISYSTKEQDFAQRLYDDLQNSGVRCWFAPKDIQGGKKLYDQIDIAIQRNDRTLLILSENSMNSEWVKTEIANTRKKEAKEKRRIIFPIRLVDLAKIQEWECFDADMGKDAAREIREYFIPDFSHWQDESSYRPAFERLLKDLRSQEGGDRVGY